MKLYYYTGLIFLRREIVNQCLETIIKLRQTDHKHIYCKFVDTVLYSMWFRY